MTWIAPEVTRIDEPYIADERTMLEGWLDCHRTTLLHKCAGLTAEQLARVVGAAFEPVATRPGPTHGRCRTDMVPATAAR